jgi:hypothetical protein
MILSTFHHHHQLKEEEIELSKFLKIEDVVIDAHGGFGFYYAFY